MGILANDAQTCKVGLSLICHRFIDLQSFQDWQEQSDLYLIISKGTHQILKSAL